jgi:hypothetical protein
MYPTARWQVMLAVAALSDREYQDRVWIRHELPHENYYDSLTPVVTHCRPFARSAVHGDQDISSIDIFELVFEHG